MTKIPWNQLLQFFKDTEKESGVGGCVETLYLCCWLMKISWNQFYSLLYYKLISHHHSVEIMEILSQTFWTKISWKHCMYYVNTRTKDLISRTIFLSIFFLLRKFRQIQDFYCKLISRIKLVDVYLAIRYISVRPHFCRVNGHMVEPYPLHVWSIYIRWFWNGTMSTIKIVLKIGKKWQLKNSSWCIS